MVCCSLCTVLFSLAHEVTFSTLSTSLRPLLSILSLQEIILATVACAAATTTTGFAPITAASAVAAPFFFFSFLCTETGNFLELHHQQVPLHAPQLHISIVLSVWLVSLCRVQVSMMCFELWRPFWHGQFYSWLLFSFLYCSRSLFSFCY